MTTIRLSDDLEARLDNLASKTGRTKTFYIKKLIEEHIDNLEDIYIAQHRLEHPADSLSSMKMRQELGLDD